MNLDALIDSAIKLARLGEIMIALGRLELVEIKNNSNTFPDPLMERNRIRGRICAAYDFVHHCNAELELNSTLDGSK